MIFDNYLLQLNVAQHNAVTADLGNLLVLAGAGSGKTRVLVNRFAWLVLKHHKVEPYNILVVTFTNKAAKEMSNRLNKMSLPNISSSWIGTFHGIAHKFLRLHYALVGLSNNFEVIDSDDQLKVIRRLIKQLNINEDMFEAKKVQNFINRQKDQGLRSSNLPKIATRYDRVMFEIYGHYENACNGQNIIDFAELLLRTYELLSNNIELLQHYRARFKHFLIDEFQDTNPIQYNFLKLLSLDAESVTAVGDDDQSIYGWRGAKVENIVKYTQEFANVNVIRLEKNYRSTKTILSAANAIINNNFDRMGKTLWTDSTQGDPIVLYGALNEEDEAYFIVSEIKKHITAGGKYNDVAILYRSNAQSRMIEECLVKTGVLYVIYGGVNFFERSEIKDILAYLRLVINPTDDAAFERIINIPTRGIGEKSLDKIKEYATNQGCNYLQAARLLVTMDDMVGAAHHGLANFIKIINDISALLEKNNSYSLTEILQNTIEITGIIDYFNKQKDATAVNRIENLQELVNAAVTFDTTVLQDGLDNLHKINEFLSYAALEGKEYISKKDPVVATTNATHVQLMTLHAAKGLEFPIVFLCGLEEGLFPNYFSKDDPVALNEERRLCYVGITRSMEKLFITYAKKRRLFGREESRIRSRFIGEIPTNLLQERSKKIFVKYPSQKFVNYNIDND